MGVVGLQFDKIVVEKFGPIKGKITVNNNVVLTNVEKADLAIGSAKQNAVKFQFEFTANYEPKLALVSLRGFLTFFDKPDAVKDIVDGWKKDKKVPKDVMSSVLNTVLSRCNVEAMLLAREVNLPPPIPLPKVQVK